MNMAYNHPNSTQKIVEDCSRLLAKRHKRIAFAESATAGYLMAAFACTEDSGSVLAGGIVCYDARIKTDLLGVDQQLIEQYSAESIPVTEAITIGVSKLIPSDCQIGVTGLLKPGGSEREDKPVGTIYTCILENGEKLTNKAAFSGTPEQIRDQCLEQICMLLIEKLSLSDL